MARMLPPYIDKTCKSQGERIIFNLLKNDPCTKDWIVLHSLNLAEHTKRLYGEIDFLLLIPGGGVFVMEVKGGDVKHQDGIWYFTNKGGHTTKSKSPFSQAQDAMFSLKAALKKSFGKEHRFNNIQFGFFVSFPQINFEHESVEYQPWQVFDKRIIENNITNFFDELMHQYTEKHRSQPWFSETESLPDVSDLEELANLFRGDFERVRTLDEKLIEFEGQVRSYTKEQYRILDSIHLNSRSFIQGSAGTGKTMIALESAIRSAADGKTVFLTCYNRLIGEWLQSQIGEWKDKITTGSLHGYLFEQSKGFDYDTSQANQTDFYKKYLPLLLKDMFQKGINKKFDKLIIDEAQDLITEEYLSLFNSMVTGGFKSGSVELYGDFEKQAIFSNISKEEMFFLLDNQLNPTRFLLKINCRNTKQIGGETALISGFDKPPFLLEHLEGVPVEYTFYIDKADQQQKLSQILNRLSEGKLSSNQLIVISANKFENSCCHGIAAHSVREIKHLKEISKTGDSVYFSTVQSFKGMESNYAIITDIEDLDNPLARSLLYIGMSRARYGLILLISETLKARYRELLKTKLN